MDSCFLVSNGGETNPLHCVKTLAGQSESVGIRYILFPAVTVLLDEAVLHMCVFAA